MNMQSSGLMKQTTAIIVAVRANSSRNLCWWRMPLLLMKNWKRFSLEGVDDSILEAMVVKFVDSGIDSRHQHLYLKGEDHYVVAS